MKRILILFMSVLSFVSLAEETLPPAPQILAAARAMLPPRPVLMTGTLKDRAANGFVRKTLDVEMTLDWRAEPPKANYKITDTKTGSFQTLEIQWVPGSPLFQWLETCDAAGVNGEPGDFDPASEIHCLGVTWSDLSFGFLWDPEAKTLRTDKKMGKACWLISVPREDGNNLFLWIEKETGRMLGAEERDSNGKRLKIIKVVSVKKFDDLWMVKDLDIIRPETGEKVSLRINEVK